MRAKPVNVTPSRDWKKNHRAGKDEHICSVWTNIMIATFGTATGLFPGSFCVTSSMQYQVHIAHH